jgi:hypothetical protein
VLGTGRIRNGGLHVRREVSDQVNACSRAGAAQPTYLSKVVQYTSATARSSKPSSTDEWGGNHATSHGYLGGLPMRTSVISESAGSGSARRNRDSDRVSSSTPRCG